MITRIHKINEKQKAITNNLKDLVKHLDKTKNETERLQKAISENSKDLTLFRGMTDEEFNKTKYRNEDFCPI